jgi:iron complex transport system ATP-binding protein
MKLEVKNLGYAYGVHTILEDISMTITPQKFTGILGPNGSGKSTLLKCMYRVLKPQHGAVFLDGESLDSMTMRSSAKKLAVMAQHSVYNFDFKVREVVFMGRSPHKKMLERDNAKDYEIVRDALEKVHMMDFAERDFSTLSGGEQQRVILARALAQQTECLILDEPTNHLDITHQLSLLKILKQQNMTICAAMHDLNLAAMFCDELYIMKDGNIQAYGTPEEVLTTEMIAKVYEVDAEIVKDGNGGLHVMYHI